MFCSLAVLIGSYIIPDQNKIIWPYFEVLRYLALLIFLALEGVTIWTLYTAIKTTLDTNKDPDDSITNVIINRFGQGIISKLMVFETRMWTYALFSNRIKSEHFQGHEHFSYWRKDGSHSNALGFILIILFEIPVVHLLIHFTWSVHLLIHFTWSAVVANVLTLLTVFSLVFFYAEYKAMKIRPVSLTQTEVIIRYGIYNTMYIKFADIETINANQHFIKRSHSIIRYNFSGVPNIAIHLKKPVEGKELIYLGLDQPTNFLSSLTKLKNKESN